MRAVLAGKWLVCLVFATAGWSQAQTCQTGDDLEATTRAGLEAASRKYFDFAAKGDVPALRQSSIPSVAEAFSGIATAVQDNQTAFAKGKATARVIFQLTAEGAAALERAEFLCGVFGKTGQTASSAVFVLTDLPPGQYAVVILDIASKDAAGDDTRLAVAFVLQQVDKDWKVGGFYVKPALSAGHDSGWFAERGRAYAAKGQNHNAWFYLLEARDLATVVPFMSTRETDRLYDETQKTITPDAPEGFPQQLAVGAKTYKIKNAFAYGIAGELNLVVKYEYPDVSDTARTYAENQAVARALVTKWPELRDGFGAIVARATEASGKDFGTLVAMKDLK